MFAGSFDFAREMIYLPVDNPLFTLHVPEGGNYSTYCEDSVLSIAPKGESVICSIHILNTSDLL